MARKKPLVIRTPLVIEQKYYRNIARMIRAMELFVRAEVVPNLSQWVKISEMELRGDRMDSVRTDIERIYERLDGITQDMFGVEWQRLISVEAAEETSAFNADKTRREIKRVIGVDVAVAEPWLRDRIAVFAADNADLITSLRTESIRKIKFQTVQALEQAMTSAEFARRIESSFGAELQRVTHNARSRARLIARDQISKLNGKLTETRQTQLGITHYRWSTSGDERVRETHKANNGKIFAWDNPPPETGHVGEQINCRCVAVPHLVPGSEADVNLRRAFNR
jgi:SPP1 gp7 family putative phage head morphogenesis protein